MVVTIAKRGASTNIDNKFTDFNYLINYPSKRTDNSPTLFLSRSAIRKNYDLLKNALPRVQIHYAVKPNIHPVILQEVKNAGGSFDICSAGELVEVLKTGISPSELIHTHPIKSNDEFDYAVKQGIRTFVVDNFDEVKKLKRFPDKNLKIMIRFRIKEKSNAVVNLQYKFGCSPEEVLPLAEKIKERGHLFAGLCFHLGSQCVDSTNYVKAIKVSSELIKELGSHGFKTTVLDIGGGFPVEYTEPVMPIDEFCKPIAAALDKLIAQEIKIISEPGRYISANAVFLVSTIIGKATRDDKIWYYLDDGLYSTFSGMLFDHCRYPIITYKTGESKNSVLAGPTCDSFDVMYDGIMLPEHNLGDKILFTGVGAYCEVSGSGFNALKRAVYEVIK